MPCSTSSRRALSRFRVIQIFAAERFLHRFRIRGLEWCFSICMAAIGAQLLHKASLYNVEAYHPLRVIGHEIGWGYGCLLLGGLRLVVLTVNGSLPRGSPHLRGLFALASLAVFLKIGTEYVDAPFPTLMPALLLPMAFFEMVNLKRTADDAAAEDKGKAGGVV